MQVLYTAAHAHFPDTDPLGGGKAVADYLVREFPGWTVLSPRVLGLSLTGSPAGLTAFQYARFCRQHERAATAAIQRQDPRSCVVLSNDISEGPDFAALHAQGYRIATIWHVDVVEYFTRFYLRGWVRPATAARWSRYRWLPDLLKLVFHKQADAVRYSARLIVPSAPMREVILRCYPDCPPDKIVVVPWGNIAEPLVSPPYPAPEDEFVILTLSRLSPEKGIERLLRALKLVDEPHVRVWIAGAPAYMGGQRYARRLRQLADDRVEFLGHITGAEKQARLQRADLFVSPSRHESYGLTIAEAEAADCPVLSHAHHGARGTVIDCEDVRAFAAALRAAIRRGRPVKEPAGVNQRSTAAQDIQRLLAEISG